MRCFWCRHTTAPRVATDNADLIPPYRGAWSTLEEQMEPVRLVELVTQRPDIADLPLLGPRLAAGVLESA